MDCCQTPILRLFSCLSYLGLRRCLIQCLAFFPPSSPTYTFRLVSPSTQNISIEVENSMRPDTPIRTEIRLDRSQNSLRFHRVSEATLSFGEKKSKVNITQENTQSAINTKCTFEQKTLLPDAHEILLISKQEKVIQLNCIDDIDLTGYYLTTKSGEIIPCVYLDLKLSKTDYILLHSHGNSSDIGVLLDTYLDLCYNLNMDVVGYDYPGYGQSTGKPDDFGAMEASEAVVEFITQKLRKDSSQIILYGQSIGSGPSTMLASNSKYIFGGLIFHSGFMSGLRVLLGQISNTNQYDMFPNIDYIRYVQCPILLMHGTEDEQIGIQQFMQDKAAKLAEVVTALSPDNQVWYAPKGKHNNIETDEGFRLEYISALRNFVELVQLKKNTLRAKKWRNEISDHIYYKEKMQGVSFQDNLNDNEHPTVRTSRETARVSKQTGQSKGSNMTYRDSQFEIELSSQKTLEGASSFDLPSVLNTTRIQSQDLDRPQMQRLKRTPTIDKDR